MKRGFRGRDLLKSPNGEFLAFALENRDSKLDNPGVDFCEITVTDLPIIMPPASEKSPCGALVDFWGIVRPQENGAPIEGIEYTCHPRMTEPTLRDIVERAAEPHPLLGCRLVHRIGFVAAGEASLFLRVGCAHRDSAYAASRAIIEKLKKLAPIWKRPIPSMPAKSGVATNSK